MNRQPSVVRAALRCALFWAASALLALPSARAEENAVSPITTRAEQTFMWGDFAALDKENNRLRQGPNLDVGGGSELEYFRIGLANVIKSGVKHEEPYLSELESLTLQWARQNPTSAFAHVLHANVLAAHGWSYRGGGYMQDVPAPAREQFLAYQMRAVDYLRQHADVALTDSYAQSTLLGIGRSLDWETTQMRAIVQDGLKRNPHDINLYFDMAGTLVPKWGGDAKTLDKYIREVTEQTRAQYGSGMYARLYSHVADLEYGHRLFTDSHADWALMKKSYEDMLARFPDSPTRRNYFAHMACIAGDKATLLALLDELGPKLNAKFWGDNGERTLEGCQRLARRL